MAGGVVWICSCCVLAVLLFFFHFFFLCFDWGLVGYHFLQCVVGCLAYNYALYYAIYNVD